MATYVFPRPIREKNISFNMIKRNLYTKMAKYYDFLAPSTTKMECKFLVQIFKKYCEEKITTILDLGCGTGRHASLLQKMGFKVTGIDLSEDMLKIARKKSPKSTFIQMDFCRPKFDKNSFDASICMWSTIGYILEEKKFKNFVKNLAKVTRKVFVLSSTNHERHDFQPEEVSERITPIPGGEIRTSIVRRYDRKTGIRKEWYKYLIIENKRLTSLEDTNRLRLWRIDELQELLQPEFKIVAVYGDYSTEVMFDKNKSDKKIIIAKKEN